MRNVSKLRLLLPGMRLCTLTVIQTLCTLTASHVQDMYAMLASYGGQMRPDDEAQMHDLTETTSTFAKELMQAGTFTRDCKAKHVATMTQDAAALLEDVKYITTDIESGRFNNEYADEEAVMMDLQQLTTQARFAAHWIPPHRLRCVLQSFSVRLWRRRIPAPRFSLLSCVIAHGALLAAAMLSRPFLQPHTVAEPHVDCCRTVQFAASSERAAQLEGMAKVLDVTMLELGPVEVAGRQLALHDGKWQTLRQLQVDVQAWLNAPVRW